MTTNPNPLHDAKERQRALDPSQSFIVQAPAGSGKTELLSQRFLVLLANVKQPEEILAITFTKKSAAEMRARIIKALKKASEEGEPESAHEKRTYELATRCLRHNEDLGWNLLENPNRLQIQTIDSFNASLTRQLPLLSNFGAPLEIVDDARSLYREAVQEFLSHLDDNFSWVAAIEKLLLHMDNDLSEVEKLLINMLAKRDQWLPYIATNVNNPELRQTLERHLGHVVTDTLDALSESFPKVYAGELLDIVRIAAKNLLRNHSDSLLTHCAELTELPGTTIPDKIYWLGISNLLLKKDLDWRKQFTIADGFPAPSSTKNPEEKQLFTHIKQRMLDLIEELRGHENFYLSLTELNNLPENHYQDTQWDTLDALHDVLRVVVAQLKLVFQQHGQIDYIENSQAAFHALGTEDDPTDITLALDYKIQHILIDEFQDTSNNQYRLLERLTSGWQPHDGRTLFVVGDPMQSIYRFREAEVGLFIRARKKGIGDLYLEPLTLSVNFRSVPGVVNWVNEHFAKVFPPFDDIASGAVSYSPSKASQGNQSDLPVVLHPFVNADDVSEAGAIIRVIEETKLNYPGKTIAILVRSRTHLIAIIPALKKANLAFRALDIEPLSTRPVIQDLLALTRALLHPGDRVAWLAILRAPWCGLTLSDLLVIAGDKNKFILFEQMIHPDVLLKLSVEGRKCLLRMIPILEKALAERRRFTLRQWIEFTWLQLGGPAALAQLSDLEDANAFFKLLDKLDVAYDLVDIKKLNEAIIKLYASPNNQADDSLQIMTIHNAKGLEFDTVILPHLERKASQDDKQLLQWMERTRVDESTDLILAPIHAVGEQRNSIYDFIKRQHNIKTDYENGRLLYVAATRAKRKLHIFFNLESKENEIKNPSNNSLLQKLWPAIQENVKENYKQTSTAKVSIDETKTVNQVKRLSLNWINPLTKNYFAPNIAFHQTKLSFNLPQNNPKYIGILIHQILQQISEKGDLWWVEAGDLQRKYIKKNLFQLGMQEADISHAYQTITKAISNTLNDPRGRWILHSHADARSELALTTSLNNIIIDRTFVDENGIRWIIDYKSSDLCDNDLPSFLKSEQAQYEKQLHEYYLAMRELDQRPIRIGLYFPLIPAWTEWQF